MSDYSPITPPPELVQQWRHEDGDEIKTSPRWFQSVCAKAAQWGADQELEACVNWLADPCAADMPSLAKDLRYSRRPKPPTLKEQALEALEAEDDAMPLRSLARSERFDTIRRALEQLP